MSSPFAMLSMLTRARRAASKRLAARDAAGGSSETAETPSIPSTPEPDSTSSDTASIISKSEVKKRRTPTLLGLSRKSSVASIAPSTTPAAAAVAAPPPASRRGTAVAPSITGADSTQSNTEAPVVFTEEPEGSLEIPLELKARDSSDGFSVLHNEEPEPEPESIPRPTSSGSGEGDWTEVAAPPPLPTLSAGTKSSSIGLVDDPAPIPVSTIAEQSIQEAMEAERKERELNERLEAEEAEKRERKLKEKLEAEEAERRERELNEKLEAQEAEKKERKLREKLEAERRERERLEMEEAERRERELQAIREAERKEQELRQAQEAERRGRELREKLEAQRAEKKRLEDGVRTLTLEKEKLDEELQTVTAENVRIAQEMKQLKDEWVNERARMIKDRGEEKERMSREKEVLRSRLVIVEVGIEGGEQARKRMQGEINTLKKEKEETDEVVLALQDQLASSQDEAVKNKESAAAAEKREAALQDAFRVLREDRNATLELKDSQIKSLMDTLEETRKELAQARALKEETSRRTESTVAHLKEKLEEASKHENTRRDQVFADQLMRQAGDIRFNHLERTSSKAPVEPVDAAVNVLYALNSEIFQSAASFADSVETDTMAEPASALEDIDVLIAKMSPILSKELITSLRSAYTEPLDVPNPLLLQLALQACLAYCCNRFITSWYPLHWDYGSFLQILHGRIVETGKTQLSETWRSTTKALLRLTSESHPQFTAYLREHLTDVLAIVGRSVSNPGTSNLVDQFEEKFSVIARLAIRMNILFDDAPSSLETFVAQPGTVYHAKTMEDTYADEDDGDSSDSTDIYIAGVKKVICTSDIGLQRLSFKGSSETVVVKPKVVLAAILSQEW